jgi:hypothetical protein
MLRSTATPEAEAALGWLLAAQGLFTVAGGEGPRRGYAMARQGVDILQRLDQRAEMIIPLISLVITAIQVHETAVAVQAARTCLEIATDIDDQWGIAKAKQLLAMRLIEDGAYAVAEQLGQEALAIFVASGDSWSESILCIELLGLLTITQQRFADAAA